MMLKAEEALRISKDRVSDETLCERINQRLTQEEIEFAIRLAASQGQTRCYMKCSLGLYGEISNEIQEAGYGSNWEDGEIEIQWF